MKPIRGGNRDTGKALAAIEKVKPARLQLNIHPDLHKMIKTICFNQEIEMSDVVLDLLRDWLLSEKGGNVNPDDLQAVWWMKPKDW
ncbi:TPA: plasmid partition protein ParG [Salmonella enterica subsp. enterica serovar Aberdeen]